MEYLDESVVSVLLILDGIRHMITWVPNMKLYFHFERSGSCNVDTELIVESGIGIFFLPWPIYIRMRTPIKKMLGK